MNMVRSWFGLAGLSLTAKLTALNVCLVLSLLAVVVVAWRILPAEADATGDVLMLNRAQRANQNIDMLHDALRSDVFSALLAGQVGDLSADNVRRSLRDNAHRFRAELVNLNDMPFGHELRLLIAESRITGLQYVGTAERIGEAALLDRAAALAEMAAFETSFHGAKEALGRQTDELARAGEAAHAGARQAADRARRLLALAALLTVVVGWCCVALVARSIRRSLIALRDVAVDIAEGQLDRRSPIQASDEVGTLAAAINQMADRLREMIDRTRRDADQGVFGSELVEALEMADSETQAHAVVARAMALVSPAHAMELLLADSSNANLERAAEHPVAGAPGCGVEAAFACTAVRRGHAVQFAHSESLNACPKLRGRAQGAVSAACVPVTFMGRALGVLHATGPVDQPLQPLQFHRLGTLGVQAGGRIGTVRAFERTQLQASTDSLTGLANRRNAEERMRQLAQEGRPFSLVMCDLDHFKRLNDTHGHPTGDDALRTFSEVVRACSHEHDVVARWGGEEFAFVLVDATSEQAMAWAVRVREHLAHVLRSRSKAVFTASFGVAHSSDAPTPELLVRLADDALYQAKANGRDQAVRAEALAPSAGGRVRAGSEQRAEVDLRMLATHG